MIEDLRALVDVGGDRPQDAHEINKLRVLSEDDKEFVQAMCLFIRNNCGSPATILVRKCFSKLFSWNGQKFH